MRKKHAHIEAHGPEILEARIAPASVVASAVWQTGKAGSVFELKAGEGLSTGGNQSGAYLLYVEKGNAMVFTTDFNNNGQLDENEITGIAAGDGLRLILFTDVHGDIVTNLREQTIGGQPVLTLSDSNNNGIDDPIGLKGDGRVLLNNKIEKIELRTLTIDDLPDQNQDGVVDDTDVNLRLAATSFSIFGNIYAGRGFGVSSDPTSGLIIDSSGSLLYPKVLMGVPEVHPTIGSIKVGTAASGEWFSFGVSNADDTAGLIQPFTPAPGQKGADIAYVRSASGTVFNLNSLVAGNGGIGAAGGDVIGVTLNADDSGGYEIIAGNGGAGANGGKGGSILQFSDLGSHTGKVVFKSGSGGTGTTGTGGSAGDFTFENMDIFGFVNIDLGSGGSGFTGGGNGASLLTGSFTQHVTDYVAGAGAGTTHMPDMSSGAYKPVIGTTKAVDFDGDGYGDLVYTTVGTSQLVVVFGADNTPNNTTDNVNTTRPDRIYLSGARNAEALSVGDLNGDGHPDIVVGSSDASNRAGIVVFLSKFEDLNNDGILSSTEDLNGNGKNDFIGFYEGRFSALPQLNGFDPSDKVVTTPYKGATTPFLFQERTYTAQPVAVGDIAVGDFDGNGMPEIAVTANYGGWEVLLFLTGDVEEDDLTGQSHLTGQFYADFGTRAVEGAEGGSVAPDPRKPYITLFDGAIGHAMIEATALSDTADHDVILVGTRDLASDVGAANSVSYAHWLETIDYKDRQSTPVTANGVTKYQAQPPKSVGQFLLGQVDRNRDLGRIDMVRAHPLDFAVLDYNGDGMADVVAITGDTAGFGYMVGSKGNGAGSGTNVSGADNAGDFFGTSFRPYDLVHIRAVDQDGDGNADDVAVFGNLGGFDGAILDFEEGGNQKSILLGVFGWASADPLLPSGKHFADVWFPNANKPGEPVLFWAEGTDNINFFVVGGGPAFPRTPFEVTQAQPGFYIHAGDGGNSIVGNGGKGGSIGSGSKLGTSSSFDQNTGELVTTTDLFGSVQFLINGDIKLTAGKGGDGFAKGGAGGDIVGVVSRGEANVSLEGGDGGRGVSAAGGTGGSLVANSIYGGYSFIAGDGGRGFTGGKGGSVIGNGHAISPGMDIADTVLPGGKNDSDDPTDNLTFIRSLTVLAGRGGDGTRGGGEGGSITNFRGMLTGTFLRMEAGDGGGSVSGTGGNGGSIKGSSPAIGSIIDSDISLIAGNGGGGVRGGAGGSVSSFFFKPKSDDNGNTILPGVLSVIAGHGGGAMNGNGGRGGDVSGISVPTRGAGNVPVLEAYNFNRILAGNGGSSAGGNGGTGGDIKDIISSVGEAAYAVVAGAGGNGLRQGGNGGNVLHTELNGGGKSTLAKLLIVAGAGGDASSLVPNVNDSLSMAEQAQKAFGGAAGRGGKGGSINDFSNSTADAHVDLIAGNGGSSLHYGTVIDKNPVVGRGGSISKVLLAGDAGNMDYTIPLKSYNDELGGQSMASWVETYIRNNTDATKPNPAVLSDAKGNVGVVVGAAGRIKAVFNSETGEFESLPATFQNQDGNGNLVDFRAASLASAVAGSIDRIAVINAARGVVITKNAIGVDHAVIGQNDYLDKNGNPVPAPTREGRLIDGALYARKITDLLGRNVDLPGRDFPG